MLAGRLHIDGTVFRQAITGIFVGVLMVRDTVNWAFKPSISVKVPSSEGGGTNFTSDIVPITEALQLEVAPGTANSVLGSTVTLTVTNGTLINTSPHWLGSNLLHALSVYTRRPVTFNEA